MSLEVVPQKPGSNYDDPAYWHEALLTPAEQERVTTTVGAVPRDVKLILDVGCGDGRVSNQMRRFFSVVSLDVNKAALQAAGGPGVQASASRLPFRDRSFDLVCCTELLEHLSDDCYAPTVSELVRVSARYVLVSVPYDEDITESTTRCPQCGLLYNLWGHQRLFSHRSMEHLSPDLRLLEVQRCGRYKRNCRTTQWIRRYIGGQWPVNKHVTCPRCGCRSGDTLRKNVVTYACAVLERVIPTRRAPRWAICLYERTREQS